MSDTRIAASRLSFLHARWVLITLVAVQFALLAFSSASMAARNVFYGCSILCDTGSRSVVPLIVTLFGIAMFVLPTLIGVLSHTWKAAVLLSVAPWWAAVIVHGRSLLTPYIGLGASFGRFDAPFWLDFSHAALVLVPLALFAMLGWFGWLAGSAWRGESAR
jgi:hypothetical protein